MCAPWRVWTVAKAPRGLGIKMPETTIGGGRRWLTFEFKQSAARLVMQEGLSLAEAALRLGFRESLLRNWRRSIKLTDAPAQASGLEAEVR